MKKSKLCLAGAIACTGLSFFSMAKFSEAQYRLKNDSNYVNYEKFSALTLLTDLTAEQLKYYPKTQELTELLPNPSKAKALIGIMEQSLGDLASIDDVLNDVKNTLPDEQVVSEDLFSEQIQTLSFVAEELQQISENYYSQIPFENVDLMQYHSRNLLIGTISFFALCCLSFYFNYKEHVDARKKNKRTP